MGALARAIPERIPAASHGSMNNLAMGSARAESPWDYYETIGGGAGAGEGFDGESGVHTHMTNTRITDPEVLERRYGVRVLEFSIRQGSGGGGARRGGDATADGPPTRRLSRRRRQVYRIFHISMYIFLI